MPKWRSAFCVEYKMNVWRRIVSDVCKMLLMNRVKVLMQQIVLAYSQETERDLSRKLSDFPNTLEDSH